MTRQAVMDGFEQFIGDAIEQTATEFSVSRVVGGQQGGLLDKFVKNSDNVHEKLVEPELEAYRTETIEQFDVILDYVESDDGIDEYREEILTTGPFIETIRDDLPTQRREAVRDDLIERHRELGEAVEPLLYSEESEFWVAARTELTQPDAEQLVEEQFSFTGPLRSHRNAFEMKTTVDPETVLGGVGSLLGSSDLEIEFTDEAMRAMRHAEREVIADAKAEVNEKFEQ